MNSVNEKESKKRREKQAGKKTKDNNNSCALCFSENKGMKMMERQIKLSKMQQVCGMSGKV